MWMRGSLNVGLACPRRRAISLGDGSVQPRSALSCHCEPHPGWPAVRVFGSINQGFFPHAAPRCSKHILHQRLGLALSSHCTYRGPKPRQRFLAAEFLRNPSAIPGGCSAELQVVVVRIRRKVTTSDVLDRVQARGINLQVTFRSASRSLTADFLLRRKRRKRCFGGFGPSPAALWRGARPTIFQAG